jgi:hypothetical protein
MCISVELVSSCDVQAARDVLGIQPVVPAADITAGAQERALVLYLSIFVETATRNRVPCGTCPRVPAIPLPTAVSESVSCRSYDVAVTLDGRLSHMRLHPPHSDVLMAFIVCVPSGGGDGLQLPSSPGVQQRHVCHRGRRAAIRLSVCRVDDLLTGSARRWVSPLSVFIASDACLCDKHWRTADIRVTRHDVTITARQLHVTSLLYAAPQGSTASSARSSTSLRV